MKKLITLFVLFLGLGMAKAQETKPNFEETVKYINNIFKENEVAYFHGSNRSGYHVSEVKVEKNGKVSFINYASEVNGSFNLFDFEKFNEKGDLELLDKNNRRMGWFSNFPPSHISKLEKALKHLRTLCVKEHDPFGE